MYVCIAQLNKTYTIYDYHGMTFDLICKNGPTFTFLQECPDYYILFTKIRNMIFEFFFAKMARVSPKFSSV